MLTIHSFLRIFTIPELRRKLLIVFGLIVVFRIAAIIPVPGIPRESLQALFAGNQLFGLLDIFSGGGLSNVSIVMLGLGPYITASIVMQLSTLIVPRLEEMQREEGEAGRRKMNQWTRMLTVPFAALQGFGFLNLLQRGIPGGEFALDFTPWQLLMTVVAIVAGTIFLMWIGELITEQGIGNGISIIIFIGIISQLPHVVGQTLATWNPDEFLTYITFALVAIVVIAGVVIIAEGQRLIPVSYAKQVRGNRMRGGTRTHLPLRVNQAGVMPIIFALSVMLFPGVVANFFIGSRNVFIANVAQNIVDIFQNMTFYGIIYFALVVAFTYFYTSVTFKPTQIAENIQKQGGFIPGIRPGKRTVEFLQYVVHRITLTGALFLGCIAVLPLVVQAFTGFTALTIGGTALLIVVSVVLETMKQLESQLTIREYEGFL